MNLSGQKYLYEICKDSFSDVLKIVPSVQKPDIHIRESNKRWNRNVKFKLP